MLPGRSLVVVLVRPSKYDDDGYVVRHLRGVLPSNTLSCLSGLTQHAVESGALSDVDVQLVALDETVDRIDPDRLRRRYLRGRARGLVALVGVQTNQFPRAQDLARQFRTAGFAVMIGGFHVSGSMSRSAPPPECQALVDIGVTLVLGEVEGRWAGLLRDAAQGTLRPIYDFLETPPDLGGCALPEPIPRLQRKFALRGTGTIDMSRGCPFSCSFCTIISVQGRTMRARNPEQVLAHIAARARRRRAAIRYYFFTDDNFSRNPRWEALFDGLIALREREGLRIDFMMQVDIAAWRIPRFVEKAARAGCVQVFIGMESIRDDNLQSVGKRQNRTETYRAAIARWHEAGVVCHVGYIIGFPNDTYDRVMKDVRTLRDELMVDQASFFLMTPLPGSEDHRRAVAAGVPLDPDYNRFDSFHATQPHPSMSKDELTLAFRDAWREFYSMEHMEQALLRQNPHTYWGLFKVFVWYRTAMREGAHPMITGFLRRRRRRERRPGHPIEPRMRFYSRRIAEVSRCLRGYITTALEMHDLWRRTRIERRDYERWPSVRGFATRAGTRSEIKLAWARLHAEMQEWRDLSELGRIVRRRLVAISAAMAAVAPVRGLRGGETDGASVRSPGRFRRANPIVLPWRLLVAARSLVVFFAAMAAERY